MEEECTLYTLFRLLLLCQYGKIFSVISTIILLLLPIPIQPRISALVGLAMLGEFYIWGLLLSDLHYHFLPKENELHHEMTA